MSRNPIINALSAALYIFGVVLIMWYGMKQIPEEDTILIPMAMLSLFTLSAATMGYLFLLKPIQLYLDGERKEAVKLFTQTLGVFAIITALALIAVFSGVLS